MQGKAEDEDIKDYDQGSCGEEVVRDSHQEDEIKQEQQKISKETVEFLKDGSHTEMVGIKRKNYSFSLINLSIL